GLLIIQQPKVRPERASEEGESIQLGRIVFQQMDLAPFSFPLERFGQPWNRVLVEFMVAKHINHRLRRKMPPNPFPPFSPQVNVTCEHDDIGVRAWDLDRAKLQVEV